MNETEVRNAATLILVRDPSVRPRVLMGQRGAGAVFMPSKFVFPGGAIDEGDATVPLARPLNGLCAGRLEDGAGRLPVSAFAACAIRELWEETGQMLGTHRVWPFRAPAGWEDFAARDVLPSPKGLRFVFRAITPRGRPRRFDARFFLGDAADLITDPDDFSEASDELAHLRWVDIDEARHLDLPFITRIVLAEVTARLPMLDAPQSVPFFRNDDEDVAIRRLGLGA